jgi:hypothetical protein
MIAKALVATVVLLASGGRTVHYDTRQFDALLR